MGTYGLRVPAPRVGYVPEAQRGLLPGPHVLYVLGTRTSHGRTVRTAYRGTPGTNLDKGEQELFHKIVRRRPLPAEPEHPMRTPTRSAPLG